MFDLTGKTFNSLTVIEEVNDGKRGRKWLCLCDCGKEIIVFDYQLKKSIVQSCGCRADRRYVKKSSADLFFEGEPLLNLRTAIINQAVYDWHKGNKQQKESLEKWFLSDWGQFISGDMGEIIVEKLRKGG